MSISGLAGSSTPNWQGVCRLAEHPQGLMFYGRGCSHSGHADGRHSAEVRDNTYWRVVGGGRTLHTAGLLGVVALCTPHRVGASSVPKCSASPSGRRRAFFPVLTLGAVDERGQAGASSKLLSGAEGLQDARQRVIA